MKINYLTLFLLIFLYNNFYAQDFNLYEKQVFIPEGDTLNYRILKPLNFDPNKQYPIHLFLHGASERGNDNIFQLTHGGKLFLKKENRENYNSWVIFPQCSKNDRWPNLKVDTWNKNFKNKIKKPNKSLALVTLLMDAFIKKNRWINKESI